MRPLPSGRLDHRSSPALLNRTRPPVRPLGAPEDASVLSGCCDCATGGVAVQDTAMNAATTAAVAERTVIRA